MLYTLGTIYLTLLLLAVFIYVILAYATWTRREQPGALPLFLLCVGLTLLSITSAMEALSPTLTDKIMWVNAQYLSYSFSPALYFLTIMQYLGHQQWSRAGRLFLLLIIPLLTFIFAWTNETHALIRSATHLEPFGYLGFLGKTAGPWWWVHIAYSLCVMLASISALLASRSSAHRFYHGQTQYLLIGLLIPLVTSLLYAFGISPSPSMDLTPAFAAIGGIFIGISVLRYRLLEITPIARAQVVESMSAGMMVIDPQLRIVDLNPACARMLSLQPQEVLSRPIAEVLADCQQLCQLLIGDLPEGSVEFTLPNAPNRYWELRLSPLYHQRTLVGQVALFDEITDRKSAQELIHHLAFHDKLTDLPNRELFQQQMYHALAQARRRQECLALLMLDLNDFKDINDTLGHHFGDLVLCEVAKRLRETVRESDCLCRLGGDEFLVLPGEIANCGSAQILIDRIREAIARPIVLEGNTLTVYTSIGMSLFPDDGETIERLLIRADERMYADKRRLKSLA